MSVRVNLRRQPAESGAVVVDDQSDRIGYLGDWMDLGTGNPAIYNGSLKELDSSGGGFFFTFTGSQIQVYGVVRAKEKGTTSTYSLDNQQMDSFVAPDLTQETDGLMMFNSGTIPLDTHTLTVSIDNASGDSPYLLDYLIFIPVPPVTSGASPILSSSSEDVSSPSSSPSSPLLPSSTYSSSRSLIISALSVSASPASSSSSQTESGPTGSLHSNIATSRPSNHVGSIVGGAIGGIVFLAILFSLSAWRLRQRKAAESESEHSTMEERPTPSLSPPSDIPGVTPYLLPRNYDSSSLNFVPLELSAPLALRPVPGVVEIPPTRNEKVRSPEVTSSGPNTTSRRDSAPSEISSVSVSDGAMSAAALAHDNERGRPDGDHEPPTAQRARSLELGHTSQGSRNRRLPAVRLLPAVYDYAGSSLRGPSDIDAEEVLSQTTTQPPAYTP